MSGLKKPRGLVMADLNVYVWGRGVSDLLRDCVVNCVWLLLLQPLVSSVSLIKEYIYFFTVALFSFCPFLVWESNCCLLTLKSGGCF